jgi:hypothetical protein
MSDLVPLSAPNRTLLRPSNYAVAPRILKGAKPADLPVCRFDAEAIVARVLG